MLIVFGILLIVCSVILGLIILIQNPKGGSIWLAALIASCLSLNLFYLVLAPARKSSDGSVPVSSRGVANLTVLPLARAVARKEKGNTVARTNVPTIGISAGRYET